MQQEEIALQILLKLMDEKSLKNPALTIHKITDFFDPKKIAQCYNDILCTIKPEAPPQ